MDSQQLGHLVLVRHEGEAVFIDENITISVEKIMENKVRLSILAPKSMPIRRAELDKRIAGEPAA